MVAFLEDLVKRYPIVSIEDGCAEGTTSTAKATHGGRGGRRGTLEDIVLEGTADVAANTPTSRPSPTLQRWRYQGGTKQAAPVRPRSSKAATELRVEERRRQQRPAASMPTLPQPGAIVEQPDAPEGTEMVTMTMARQAARRDGGRDAARYIFVMGERSPNIKAPTCHAGRCRSSMPSA